MQTKQTPKLTVIMPCYNREKYLTESIESILNQSFSDFEFIIVDDCSADNSWNIINKYKNVDARIIALKNKKNLGIAGAINAGLNIARGEYITGMDSDDISLTRRFEKQVRFLDENKKYGLCSIDISSFNNEGQILSNAIYKETYNGIIAPLEWLFLWTDPIPDAPSMYRKEIIKKHSISYDSNYKVTSAYNFLGRVTLHTRISRINEVLYKYRIHSGSTSVNNLTQIYKESIDSVRNFSRLLTGITPPFFSDYLNEYFYLSGGKSATYNLIEISNWMNKLLLASKKRWQWSEKEYNNALSDANIRIMNFIRNHNSLQNSKPVQINSNFNKPLLVKNKIKYLVDKIFSYYPPYRKLQTIKSLVNSNNYKIDKIECEIKKMRL